MLPTAFLERMKTQLEGEFDHYRKIYDEPSSVGLRVNTLKLNPDYFSSICNYPLTSLPWTGDGFMLPPEIQPGKHPYHAAGLYYIQDPSAMAVTVLLDPQPGERILDLAAAPGGKTTHIAAILKNRGFLVSNDIHPRRVRALYNNLERWGARNVVVLNETPERLVDHFGDYFDKVLVDAPCSGEGMFRKDPNSSHDWSDKLVERCAVRQDDILFQAAKLVRPGGNLVYATCTFAPEENEGTINRFLETNRDFNIVNSRQFAGFSPGRPDWISTEALKDLGKTVRLWPHLAPGEGHYIAVLQRDPDSASLPCTPKGLQPSMPSEQEKTYFFNFIDSNLKCNIVESQLSLQGICLYQLPEGIPDLRGLRVIHWGWWLGTIKVKRFEPSHALVMALNTGDTTMEWPLESDDPQVVQFIQGEVLSSSGENGWVMVSVDGFPLGWGKRVQNRLKSHSPKWLRGQ